MSRLFAIVAVSAMLGATCASATISTGGSSVTMREMRRSATSGVASLR